MPAHLRFIFATALALAGVPAHADEPTAPTPPVEAPADAPPSTHMTPALTPLQTARALGTAFADLAEAVRPVTVHIQATKSRGISAGLSQLLRDYRLETPAPTGPALGQSTGSGVILSADGLVLTNHHVIGGSSDIIVTLHDKRRYPATLIGSDPRTDVAVLQLTSDERFSPAIMGDSDKLRVGEWVVAVGHPFEFQFTVTAGIVSARGRRNLNPAEISDFIQTDAAVNPGSSGGPLFNLDGEVIGINTAIFNPGPQASHAGISLAIPANMATRIVRELQDTGRVARAGIGVSTRDRSATPENPRPGAEVTRVLPDGPAEEAGVRRGDVIIAVDGEPIATSEDLRGFVLTRGIDTVLTLRFERGREVQQVEMSTRDDRDLAAPDLAVPNDAAEWGGMVLAPVTAERAGRLGVKPPDRDPPGLLVLAVAPASASAAAGLLQGDILVEIGRKPVGTLSDLWELAGSRRSATVTLWRNGGEAVAILAGLERRNLPPERDER
jgi:serine protease Do